MAWGPEEHRQGLLAGGELFRHVVTGGTLDPMPAAPLPLRAHESAFADLPLEYSRFYSMNVSYRQHSIAATGSAGFVLGALAVNAAGNAAARNRARAQASPQWREHHVARAVLTSTRVLIVTRSGPLSFWHSGLDDFLPDPEGFVLSLTFPDCEPVRLRGPGVPWLAVAMSRLLYEPEQLTAIPGFAGLAAWHAGSA